MQITRSMINISGLYFQSISLIYKKVSIFPRSYSFRGPGGQKLMCPHYKQTKMRTQVSWAVVQHFRSLITLVPGKLTGIITKIQNSNMPAKMYHLFSTTFLPLNVFLHTLWDYNIKLMHIRKPKYPTS